MPPNEQPELLMPVSETSAALQFFVEAMKANTATLERVGKAMEGMQREQKETLNLVHDTRERVIRIESGGHAEDLAELKVELAQAKEEIGRLKANEDKRAGAVGAAEWAARVGPWLLALVLALAALAGWQRTT